MIKESDYNYIQFNREEFEKTFPDDLLINIILKESEKEENHYFEYKGQFNQKKNYEIAELITSIANADSGIIFFGYDEKSKELVDVNCKLIEQKISGWNRELIRPSLDLQFRTVKHQNGLGYFILIPAVKDLASVKGRINIRKGTNKEYIFGEVLTNHILNRDKMNLGHIYLKYLYSEYIARVNKNEILENTKMLERFMESPNDFSEEELKKLSKEIKIDLQILKKRISSIFCI